MSNQLPLSEGQIATLQAAFTDWQQSYIGSKPYAIPVYDLNGGGGGGGGTAANVGSLNAAGTRINPATLEGQVEIRDRLVSGGYAPGVWRATVAGTGWAVDDILFVKQDNVAGALTPRWYRVDSTGDFAAIAGNVPATSRGLASGSTPLAFETYVLDGTLNTVTATPWTGTGNPAGVVGDRITIAPPWRKVAWEFARATQNDPGDGSIAILQLDGRGIFPDTTDAYAKKGGSFGSDGTQNTTQSLTFVALGQAYIEIEVIR